MRNRSGHSSTDAVYEVLRNPEALLVENTAVTAVFEPMKRRMIASFGSSPDADVFEMWVK